MENYWKIIGKLVKLFSSSAVSKTFCLLFLVSANLGFAQTILEPKETNLENCKTYIIKWDKHNWNTDRYDLIVRHSGLQGSTPVTAKEVINVELKEDWVWGGQERSYPITIGGDWTGTLVVEVTARRRAGGKWRAQTTPKYKTYTIANIVIEPPLPNAYVECKPGTYTISPEHINSNYTCNWYSNLYDAVPIYQGRSYTKTFNAGLHGYYVSYTNNAPGSCGRESVRMPVVITVLSGAGTNDPIARNFREIEPEPDNRLGYSECTYPGTYYDLEGGQITSQDLGISTNNVPNVDGSFNFSYSDWEDRNYYGRPQNPVRVCNRHLPTGNGTSRSYTREASLDINIEIRNQINDDVYRYPGPGCNNLKANEVIVSKTAVCKPNISEPSIIWPNDLSSRPTSISHVSICPNSNITIGPAGYVNNWLFTYSYQWTPADGLSNANSARTGVDYETINLNPGERWKRYELNIKRRVTFLGPLGTTEDIYETHIVYVYKCPDCLDADMEQLEDWMYTTEKNANQELESKIIESGSLVYPNPVKNNQFNVFLDIANVPNIKEARITIKDIYGKLYYTELIDSSTSLHAVHTSLMDGNYIMEVLIDNQLVHSEQIQIKHEN